MWRRSAIAAALTSMLGAGAATAQDLVFQLINQSGATLVEFYASPTDVDVWEEDILGADVLLSGYRLPIVIADGRAQCGYDLRMVFADGSALEDTINLCDTGSYTITP